MLELTLCSIPFKNARGNPLLKVTRGRTGGGVLVATRSLPDVTWLKFEVKEFDIRPRPRLDDILDLLADGLTGAH